MYDRLASKIKATGMLRKADDQELMGVAKLESPEAKRMFWSGGFDSTALLLSLINRAYVVRPIYMYHSGGTNSVKCRLEVEAQDRIRAHIKKKNPAMAERILESDIWDYDILQNTPAVTQLSSTLEELCAAIGISFQYGALRFCRDAHNYPKDPPIALSVVSHDELWATSEALKARNGAASALERFFEGFEFPIWNKTKLDLWEEAGEFGQEILLMTFSCEFADRHAFSKTCLDVGLSYTERCLPCKRRLQFLHSSPKVRQNGTEEILSVEKGSRAVTG